MLYKKELDGIPVDAMPEIAPGALYVGAAKVVELKRSGKILVVDFYQRADKAHKYRFCTDGKNYCTKSAEAGSVWTEQNPRVWLDRYSSADRREDQQLAADFVDYKMYGSTNLLGIVDQYISHHRWEQRDRAYDRRETLRKEHFAMYPAYPANLESYCNTHLFTPVIFFSTLSKDGRRHARCSGCGAEFEAPKAARSRQPTTCPACGRAAIYRATWIKGQIEDKSRICIVENVDGQKLLRWVEVLRRFSYPNFKMEYEFEDYAFNLHLRTPQGIKTYFYKWTMCGHYYGRNDWYRGAIGDLCYDCTPVYMDNLPEVYGERYHGIDLKKAVSELWDKIPFARLVDDLERIPATEYLLKMGLTNLAASVRSIPGVMGCLHPSFSGVLGVDGQFAKMYRELNITLSEHCIIRQYGKYISREQFEMFRELDVSTVSTDTVRQVLAGMSFARFVHYFTKQKQLNPDRNTSHILTSYRDYINMSTELGVDMSHKSIRFPKNCVEAHNRILPRFNQVKQEAEDNRFVETVKPIYEKLRAKDFEKGGFCIVLPQRRSDLTTEGQSLNHCVGGEMYYKNHIAGKRLIFFVREIKNRAKPFFTMEVDMTDFRICQLYGFGDCSAPDNVRKFAEAFVKKLAPAKVTRKTA